MPTPKHTKCTLTFAGDTVGVIKDSSGVKATWEVAEDGVVTERSGNLKEFFIHGGRLLKLDWMELDTTPATLALIFPDMTADGDALIYNSDNINVDLTSKAGEMTLHPDDMDSDTSLDIVAYGLIKPTGGSMDFAAKKAWIVPCSFETLFRDSGDGDIITIGATADTTAPTISSKTPAADATGVAIDASIYVTFSEDMQASFLEDAKNVALIKHTDDSIVACTLSYDAATKILTINPDSNLTTSEVYRVFISKNCRDTAGNQLAANQSWMFTITS